jgi:glucose-1-phosphate thymidylyltransferase
VLIVHDIFADDDFVMYLGENLLQQDLVSVVSDFEAAREAAPEPPVAQILLTRVPDPGAVRHHHDG